MTEVRADGKSGAAARGWGGWDVSPRVAALLALRAGAASAERVRRRAERAGVRTAPSSLWAALGRLRQEGLADRDSGSALGGRGGRPLALWRLTGAGEAAALEAAGRVGRIAALGEPRVWVVRDARDRASYLVGWDGSSATWGARAEAIRHGSREEARATMAGWSAGVGEIVSLVRRAGVVVDQRGTDLGTLLREAERALEAARREAERNDSGCVLQLEVALRRIRSLAQEELSLQGEQRDG